MLPEHDSACANFPFGSRTCSPEERQTVSLYLAERLRRALVFVAFFAAAERPEGPLVRTALRAAAERAALPRRAAACFACRDSARGEAVSRGSFFRTFLTARDTRG